MSKALYLGRVGLELVPEEEEADELERAGLLDVGTGEVGDIFLGHVAERPGGHADDVAALHGVARRDGVKVGRERRGVAEGADAFRGALAEDRDVTVRAAHDDGHGHGVVVELEALLDGERLAGAGR